MRRITGAALALPAVISATIGGAYLLAPHREYAAPRELVSDGQFVTVNGYALHYTDEGPRNGAPVVLVHGFGAWAFTWRAARAALAAAGHRVITVDQLGSGASARPAGPIYTTQLQAELLLGALDLLGVAAAQFVGHSYGGRVTMQVVLFAPERVRSLALIDPEAFNTARPPIAQWLRVPGIGYALAFYSTTPQLVRTGLKLVCKRTQWMTDAAIAGYAAPLYVAGSAAAQVWQGRSPKDGAQPVPEHLAEIRQKTLIIWGGDDPVFPAADGHRLAEIMPDAQLLVLPGVGHLPHEEAEQATTQALLAFLA